MSRHIPRPMLDEHLDERLRLLSGQFPPARHPATEADRIHAAVQAERDRLLAEHRAARAACWSDGFNAGQMTACPGSLGLGVLIGIVLTVAAAGLAWPWLA